MCPGCAAAIDLNEVMAGTGLLSLVREAEKTATEAKPAQPTPELPEDEEQPLYAAAAKIYPQRVKGTFRRIKWIVLILTLGVYYLLPFVRWDRGPNAPGQAVLLDLPNRRFYFFFIEIWPQEFYYVTGLLVVAAMTLFLMNAVAGRVWCGYLCPQTVWTDLFFAVERFFEGDRREHMRRDQAAWTAEKVLRKAGKHVVWLMIAWWTGGAWVLYFADAPTLVWDLATFEAPLIAYLWIGILTVTTYALAGHLREQVCLYMCPWPRIQAALTDEHALNVTYRYDRGEPRGSVKKNDLLREQGLPAGDCIDCLQCVHVCPTGVDIRGGANLGCIQCGLCIDACDVVMAKLDRPTGLIAYDNEDNVGRRQRGEAQVVNIVRPRTIIYVVIIAAVSALMGIVLATRSDTGISVIHDRNPVFVRLADGGVRNGFTIRVINKTLMPRSYRLFVRGVPDAHITVFGEEENWSEFHHVSVGPDQTRELRILVTSPKALPAASVPVTFTVVDFANGERGTADDHFLGPAGAAR